MSKFKPLLAATVELETFHKINFPVMVSPKLDGIRVLIRDGVAVTRSLKPVRNKQVQHILGKMQFCGLDGEIIVGPPIDPHAFRATTSGVMAEEGESDFRFYVFDNFLDSGGFMHRFHNVQDRLAALDHSRIKLVEHPRVADLNDLLIWEQRYLDQGFEGIMIRSLDGEYKMGRSTLNQGILLKLKRFADTEATIIGFVERLKNMNEQTRDNLGHAERSSHKENMIPEGTLGAFKVKSEIFKEEFTVGSGLNDEERQEIWDNQEKYLGQTLKFKYFAYGNYDQPRFPIYLGIRPQEDIMSDKANKPEGWINQLESIFPDASFIGWASVQADGKVDISKIEEKPMYASVPVFLPKDQLARFKEFNEEQNKENNREEN